MRALLAIAVLIVACAPAGSGSAPTALPTVTDSRAIPAARLAVGNRQRVEVLSVTDGDTIRVSIDGRSTPVRYIGIDAPETVDPRKDVQCFGKEASDANHRLVEGKMVELEKDISEVDRFDRLLRYVYVDLGGRMVMVNEELVRTGFAQSASFPPDIKFQSSFTDLERDARAAGLGLWGTACGVATPAPLFFAPPSTSALPPAQASLSVTISASRYGLVSAATLAGASCTAQARLPSGNVSQAQGLAPTRVATASGAVSWTYTTIASTNPGTGTYTVTCTLDGVTRSHSANFTVP